MKTKKGFNLRQICGENVIVADGIENIDFSKIISMNESAAYLWNKVQQKDFNAELLKQLLTEEYDVDDETAMNDAHEVIRQWTDAGIVTE